MNKKQLQKLALLGITGGILVTNTPILDAAAAPAPSTPATNDANSQNLGWHEMTEKELLMELNGDGAAIYKTLTPEGKELARKVASMRCNHTNECKGLNGCKTDKNDCAGHGQCKGTGKCAIADKNLAVELVAKKMAAKRAGAN